jgi:RNA polymerase sigma-B factor
VSGSVLENEDDVVELFARLPDPQAREALVHRFLPLADHLARRFVGRGESLEDLVQVASLGLVQAIDRFDPDRDVRFSTFAAVTITGELKRHFRDRGWSIRVPRNLQEAALLVNRTLRDLTQELGRSPTVAEVADRTDLAQDQVLEAMEAARAYATASLDSPLGDDDAVSVGETIGHRDPGYEVAEGWASLVPSIGELPARERRILYLRFFRGMTQTEIAADIGISQMHVSRLLSQTLERLRADALADGD